MKEELYKVGSGYFITQEQRKQFKADKVKIPRPNVLLNDLKRGFYLTYLDPEKDLEEDESLFRQYEYGRHLVYWLVRDRKGNLSQVPITRNLEVLPEHLCRHLECREARTIFTIPATLMDKINTTILVVLGIVALVIAWIMVQG